MDFTGKITFIGTEEKVGQNETPKITFVVEEEGKEYPSSVAVDLRKDKIEELKSFKVGDSIKISMNFRAREYNGKYFNSISAWRLAKAEWWATNAAPVEEKDDLPF